MPSSNMTTSSYPQTCTNCGRGLQPVVLDPSTPPWMCFVCKIGWWVSELLPGVRGEWHGGSRSFRHKAVQGLRAAMDIEMKDAKARGSSARMEHLPLLGVNELTNLVKKLDSMIPPDVTVPESGGAVKVVKSTGPMVDLRDQAKVVLAGKQGKG